MKKLIFLFALLFSLSLSEVSMAQCSMCRQVAASSIQSGQKTGIGLNKGILFLMSIPYLLGGTAAFMYWKYKRKPDTSVTE
jgi:hypothetical protein